MTWDNNGVYDDINVYIDGVLEDTLPGTATSYTSDPFAPPANPEICLEPVVMGSALNTACCTVEVILDPVAGVACSAGTDTIDVTWTNPGTYDAINILVNGVLENTVLGDDTSYTTLPGAPPATVEVCVEGVLGGNVAEEICCSGVILGPLGLEECSTPGTVIPGGPAVEDTIDVMGSVQIGDLTVALDLTHPFSAELVITLTSPLATQVTLHDPGGLTIPAPPGIHVSYNDAGVPNQSIPYDCYCLMQPEGPGSMGDYMDENTFGPWVLAVANNGPDDATLDSWCLQVVEGCPVFPPSGLTCAENGPVVDLAWTNNGAYDNIDVVRGGVVIATIGGTETTFSDMSPVPGTGIYEVAGVDTANMCASTSQACTILVSLGLEQCTPNPPTPFGEGGVGLVEDIISVADDFLIEDLQVEVEITHAFLGDVELSVMSPGAVSVTLHAFPIAFDPGIYVTYDDAGMPFGEPFDCFCRMQPLGPGSMSDFDATVLPGDWTLSVVDTFPNSGGGTLDTWCLLVFGDPGIQPGDDILRGDCDGDGTFNGLVDGLRALNFQFVGGTPPPPCLDQCDFDNNNVFNGLVDGLLHLNHQFSGGPPPAPPGLMCGPDPDTLFDCQNPTCP